MDSETNKEYSVNWKNHMSYVRRAFDHLLSSNELIDVTLFCEGRKIGAHKILLSACSTFFRETFKTIPCQHPVVILYGIEYNILLDILHFIYNGEVKVEPSKLESFLKVAQNLQINGLNSDKVVESQNNELITIGKEGSETITYKEIDEEEISLDCASTSKARTNKRPKSDEDSFIKEKVRKEEHETFPLTIKTETFDVDYEDEESTQQELSELEYFEHDSSEVLDFEDSPQATLQFGNNDIENDTSEFFVEDVKDLKELNISETSVPSRSYQKYISAYERFLKWCNDNETDINLLEDEVLLVYFKQLAEARKPSSLWAQFSMLKTVLNSKKNIDISKYKQVLAFLKSLKEGYKPKQSKILTKQEVVRFLKETNDYTYLMMKVALIIGLRGGCLRDELTNLRTDNVIDEGRIFRIVICNNKNKIAREFFVTSGNIQGLDMVDLMRQYIALRPSSVDHTRFFLSYRNGKCTKQPVGVHTLGAIPRIIASILKLPNPKDYTSVCFRKSSKSLQPYQ